jgi:hypothetical protein
LAYYGGNANVGRYLQIFPGEGSDTAPYLVPTSSILIGLTLGSAASTTSTVGVFKTTDLVNPIASITITAGTEATDVSQSVLLSALDKLAVRVTAVTGTLSKPRFAMYISGA